MVAKKKTEPTKEKVSTEVYKVIHPFKDLEDKSFLYQVGDSYPREGLIPTKKRIEELKGAENKLKRPLIQ